MISKKKAVIWGVIAILITNTITFVGSNFVTLPFMGKVSISAEDYALLQKFQKVFLVKDIIEKRYVDKVDENKLVEGAVRGLVAGVEDPYTAYMDAKEYEAFNVQTTGEYAGVGLVVTALDRKITVVSPIEDTPAEKAGIKTGDVIIRVDDKDVSGDKLDEAVSLMKGKAGTKVKLTIIKEGAAYPVDITITRANITMKTVKGEILKDNIGYIRITQFDENTSENFKKELKGLQTKGMKGLILDLRDNPGGLLDQCAKIADELLGEGTIVYTIDNKNKKEVIKSDSKKINVPLAVLVNGGSASASEIVSGAVKDTKSGTLIGTKTFGKGLVQTIQPLSDKSAVKVTIARYYTPSGVCIQGKGIEPDIVIDLPENLRQKPDLTRQEDVQLNKAIEVINQQVR